MRRSIALPKGYYRLFTLLGTTNAPMRYYRQYRQAADKLQQELSDMTQGPQRVIGVHGVNVVLEKTNSPFDVYWTADVLRKVSDQCGLWELWQRMANDP